MLTIFVRQLIDKRWHWIMKHDSNNRAIAQSYTAHADAWGANRAANNHKTLLVLLGVNDNDIKIEYGQYDIPIKVGRRKQIYNNYGVQGLGFEVVKTGENYD